MTKNGLTKKELKRLRKDAYDCLPECHVTKDYDVCIQSMCVNGYIDLVSTFYINEKIFIDECTKILEKLMKNLSTKNIDRKYMRTYTIDINDLDTSEAFRWIMNQWTLSNPYLYKIAKIEGHIAYELYHIFNAYIGQEISGTKDIDHMVSKCFSDICNIRKTADEMFNEEGTPTYVDGLLYLVRFCLYGLDAHMDYDRGRTVDTDKWDETKKYLCHLESLFESLTVDTKSRKDAIKTIVDLLVDTREHTVDMVFKDVEDKKNVM